MPEMSDEELDARLEAWGRWLIRYEQNSLGFGRNTFARLIDDGGFLSHAQGASIPPSNPDAEQIERFVAELRRSKTERYRNAAIALKLKYVTRDTNMTLDQVARRAGISRRLFSIRLDLGRAWIQARMLQPKF